MHVDADGPQWVESVCNRRVHFIQPLSDKRGSERSEWAVRANGRASGSVLNASIPESFGPPCPLATLKLPHNTVPHLKWKMNVLVSYDTPMAALKPPHNTVPHLKQEKNEMVCYHTPPMATLKPPHNTVPHLKCKMTVFVYHGYVEITLQYCDTSEMENGCVSKLLHPPCLRWNHDTTQCHICVLFSLSLFICWTDFMCIFVLRFLSVNKCHIYNKANVLPHPHCHVETTT